MKTNSQRTYADDPKQDGLIPSEFRAGLLQMISECERYDFIMHAIAASASCAVMVLAGALLITASLSTGLAGGLFAVGLISLGFFGKKVYDYQQKVNDFSMTEELMLKSRCDSQRLL